MNSRWSRCSMGILLAAGSVGALAAVHRWYGRALLDHGSQLVADRHYARAVRVLRRAVAVAPGEPRAHYYLSLAYAATGDLGPWLSHLEQAMRRAARSIESGAPRSAPQNRRGT
jgi:tetratricopeptide (TPR) repeat protein